MTAWAYLDSQGLQEYCLSLDNNFTFNVLEEIAAEFQKEYLRKDQKTDRFQDLLSVGWYDIYYA